MDIEFVFKIAAIGLLITVVSLILTRAGREDIAALSTLAGLIVVLMMVASKISELFEMVKNLFRF